MDSRESRKGRMIDRGVEHSKSVLGLLGALADGVIGCDPLNGAVSIAKEVVEWVEKVRTNKKDCASLARQTYEFMYTIVMAVEEEGKNMASGKLGEELAGVQSVLTEIRDGVRELGAQPFLKALTSRGRTAEDITGFKEKLSLSLQLFQTSSLIAIRQSLQGLQLQKSMIPEPNIEISASLPAPSLHLIGRDSLLSKGVSVMTGKAHNHLAILGTGGIGKTSLALAVLHSPAIKETFGDLRFFVPCDSITAAGPLVFAILKTLGVDASAAAGDPLAKLEAQISGMKPFILVLDNFETPWTSPNQEVHISNVLQRLSVAPQVHVIVTMRGHIPPSHSSITWTSLLLDMLTLQEAIELFVRINPSLPDSEQPDLQKLLKELGGLPLAVKLLAELWQTSTCSRLLAQWKKKKTALLRSISGTTKDRLTNLDISISISLESPVITAVHEAPELLYVLCHLPNGVLGGIEKLASMDLSLEDLDGAISALYATGLVTGDIGEAIKVPSAIQHYILDHPLATHHLYELYNYYITLINAHSSFTPGDPEFLVAKTALGPEIGNIIKLIVGGLRDHRQFLGLIDAAMNFTEFQYWECPSMEVIDALMHHDASTSVTADLHYNKARLHMKLHQYNHAAEAFCKAGDIYITEGPIVKAIHCMQSVGNIFSMQSDHTEAITALQEAQTEYLTIGDRLGAAQCLQSLGDIYRMQNKITEASAALQEAQAEFKALGNRLGATQCLQSLGDVYRIQSNFAEATTTFQEAQSEMLAIGNRLGAAQCMQSLGDIYRMQSSYTEATTTLQEALAEFLAIGDHFSAAQSMQSLGDVYRHQARYTESTKKLLESCSIFKSIGNQLQLAWSHRWLSFTYSDQQLHRQALVEMYIAKDILLKIEAQEAAAMDCQDQINKLKEKIQAAEEFSSVEDTSTVIEG